MTDGTSVGRLEADILYPNPASSILRLQLKDDVQTTGAIQVYDVAGKLNNLSVKRIGKGTYEVNVSVLAKGVYLMKANTVKGVKTFRFIKI